MKSTHLRLALIAVTGLLPIADATAEVNTTPVTVKIIGSSPKDFAPVTAADATTTPPTYSRLRKTKDEQPGEEMAHFAMFGDGINGLYFSMSTDLVDPANGSASFEPTDRIQLALVPFHLVKNADGSVGAAPDYTGIGTNTDITGGARFVTTNQGNEYRNANHPIAYPIDNGNAICAEYNYQPNNTNNTARYMECFNSAGATVLAQTQIYAKTNDDCSMNQDKSSTWFINAIPKTGATGITQSRLIAWRGCNGNGQDDGWAQGMLLEATHDATNPNLVTKVTFTQTSDVSLCQQEERSHGYCTTSATDLNTAICSWTEGNTQPQRDGTWLAAIDLTKTGDASIYWKQQIDGKKTMTDGSGNKTYSMRAMHDRIMNMDPTTKALVPSDYIIWRSGDVYGNNNTNDGKGGAYFANNVAVIKADKTGMQYIVPLQDISGMLLGMDGTHLGMTGGLFGTTDNPAAGLMFTMGSQTGGGVSEMMRVVSWDKTTNMFKDGGSMAGAPYDRHLYSNYLGNNPGNQGRNYTGSEFIKNPFATGAANEAAYLMVTATTGKPMDEMPSPQCPDCAQKKLAAFLTIVPAVTTPDNGGTGGGTGGGNGGGGGTSNPVSGGELGGCSTTGGSSGAGFILVLGLAGLIRRRRSN